MRFQLRLLLPVPLLFALVALQLPVQAQRIRIAAGNISSGNGQDYDQGHGIRIFQGVKPDIILIQESKTITSPAMSGPRTTS